MGVTWQEFWGMNPHIIKCLQKGHIEKIKQEDYLNYVWWGEYGMSALICAIDRCFNKNAKSQYVKEPALSKVFESEEEIYEKELRKALLAEEQWIMASRNRGLPETVI